MPKGGSKGKASTGRYLAVSNTNADFTVYDYAKTGKTGSKSCRMSKGTTNTCQQLKTWSSTGGETLSWFDKELSDYDICAEELEELDTTQTECKEITADESVRRRRKKIVSRPDPDAGCVYPVDLWVVIGDWIHPEDVQLFASICHGSHFVSHTARFWFGMYRRVYQLSTNVAESLEPAVVERTHGLRARVIRSLFILYPPFQQRLQARVSFQDDPDYLKGAICTLMWHLNVKEHWHFYFKFKRTISKPQCAYLDRCNKKVSLLDGADIHHNAEAGYCVLQVISQSFTPFPPSVMGQTLATSSLSVGHQMRYHKMKLTFTPQHYISVGSHALSDGITLIMDPVFNAYVLNWWDPKYPHQAYT